MANGLTTIGVTRILEGAFRNLYAGGAIPSTGQWYIALATSDAVPSIAGTNTLGQLSTTNLIAEGNGYTHLTFGLDRNATDFDVLTNDTANAYGLIQVKNAVWSAAGGSIPASGTGAFYALLTDDNATTSAREILGWWDLTSGRSVGAGAQLTLEDLELRLTPTS